MSRIILVDRYSSYRKLRERDPRFFERDNNRTSYFIPVVETSGGREQVHLRPQSLTSSQCCEPGYVGKLTTPNGYYFASKDYPYHKVYIDTDISKYKLGIDPKDNYY